MHMTMYFNHKSSLRVMTNPSNSPLDICHPNSRPIPSSLLILHLPTHSNLPIHSHPCLDSRLDLQGRAGSNVPL